MFCCARSVCIFSAVLCVAYCANILVVTPTVSKSHYAVFDPIIDALLKRGHHITVVTTNPSEKPVQNLTEISVVSVRKMFFNDYPFTNLTAFPESFWEVAPKFSLYIRDSANVFSVPEVANLIASNSTFDIVFSEMFNDDLFISFAHRFKAPAIVISSCYMFPFAPDRFAIPANPSYFPTFYSWYSVKMNFFQRLRNSILDLAGKALYWFVLEPEMTEIVRKHFGSETPPVGELVKNTSLYFTNTHLSFFNAHPYPPQVVDISGIHLKPTKPLDQSLDRWMNESAGVIYFSFGSMLRGATLPAHKVQAFVEVFRALPQRVLWKWEDDQLDNIPANVKIMKWLPQRDVLAHPSVKVFISHGGLLGSTEAVVSGVPILGIPMYGDQPNNVAALVDKGVAVHVDYNNISAASLSWALNTLLTDSSYSDNAKSLSQRFLDRPLSPLDTAVFWTEYVIRHKGAPHLRSAAVHLAWYQYYLLDVAAFCIAAIFIVLATVYYAVKSVLKLLGCISSKKEKTA